MSTIYRHQSVWQIAILNTVSEDDKRLEGVLCSKSTAMLLCVGCGGGSEAVSQSFITAASSCIQQTPTSLVSSCTQCKTQVWDQKEAAVQPIQ